MKLDVAAMANAYTNSQILAAVVTHWSRPAISQLATSKLTALPMVQQLQQGIISMGIVSQSYNISADIDPFMQIIASELVQPVLERYLSGVPDQSIPALAHGIVDKAIEQGSLSILDGFVTFEADDLQELKSLLDKNLPLQESTSYEVIE